MRKHKLVSLTEVKNLIKEEMNELISTLENKQEKKSFVSLRNHLISVISDLDISEG